MFTFNDIAVVFGMMLLRIGVPALVIVAVGYMLKRLDLRWEAEAREQQAQMAEQQPDVQPEAPRPVAPSPRPVKQPTPQPLPFIPPPAVEKEQRPGMYAGVGLSAPAKSSWESKSCSQAVSAAYSATGLENQTCWQVRMKAEGQIPEECVNCDVFQRYPTM